MWHSSFTASVLGSMRRYEFRLDRIDVDPHLILRDIPEIISPIPEPGPFLQLGVTGLTATRFAGSHLLDQISMRGVRPVDYLIVRNPWGFFEGSGPSTTSGSHQALDVDWWRSIPQGAMASSPLR